MPSVSGTSSTSELIEQLIYIDSQPIRTNESKIKTLQSKKSIIQALNTQMLSLKTATENLYKAFTEPTKIITPSKEGISTLTITDESIKSDISLEVQNLAKALTIGGDKIEGEIGFSGEFTIKNGEKSLTIKVSEKDTISSIKDRINKESDSGISASVIDGRLILSSTETGEKEFKFTDSDNVLSKLGILDESGEIKNTIQKGENAKIKLNGIEIERGSNAINDAMEGVTLNLQDTGNVVFKVEEDIDSLVTAIEEFVNVYNKTVDSINNETNAETGSFKSDSGLIKLKNDLRNSLASFSNSTFKLLSDIGLEMSSTNYGKNAKLEISDKDKLKESILTKKKEVLNMLVEDKNDNGKIDKTDGGILGTINKFLEEATSTKSGSKGLFSMKLESIENSIRAAEDKSERLEASIEKKRAIYQKQFLYMDQMVELYNAQLLGLTNMLGSFSSSNTGSSS